MGRGGGQVTPMILFKIVITTLNFLHMHSMCQIIDSFPVNINDRYSLLNVKIRGHWLLYVMRKLQDAIPCTEPLLIKATHLLTICDDIPNR